MHPFGVYGTIKGMIIAVVGCGRSGTNLLARIIGSHPAITPFIEHRATFDKVAKAADVGNPIPDSVKWQYGEWERDHGKIVVKDHPLYYCSDAPQMPYKYVYIQRNLLDVVYSTLNHKGCFERLSAPPGNLNGGLLADNYQVQPPHVKATHRWLNAVTRWERIRGKLNGFAVSYEQLVREPQSILPDLAAFLGVSNAFTTSFIRGDTVGKWQGHFSEIEHTEIFNTISTSRA